MAAPAKQFQSVADVLKCYRLFRTRVSRPDDPSSDDADFRQHEPSNFHDVGFESRFEEGDFQRKSAPGFIRRRRRWRGLASPSRVVRRAAIQ